MKRLVRNPDIVWRVEKRKEEQVREALERGEAVGDQGTVTLILSGMMHQLNFLGGLVWKLCDGNRGLDEVVDALAPEFDVGREDLARDVEEFVEDLLQRGWLRHG